MHNKRNYAALQVELQHVNCTLHALILFLRTIAQGFLRVSRKLAKQMPFADDDEDRLAVWCSDSLVAMQVSSLKH